jgi:hypothetical protein
MVAGVNKKLVRKKLPIGNPQPNYWLRRIRFSKAFSAPLAWFESPHAKGYPGYFLTLIFN